MSSPRRNDAGASRGEWITGRFDSLPLHQQFTNNARTMSTRIERDLPCRLTEEEVAEAAKHLAANIKEYNELDEEYKAVARDYRERLKLIDSLQRKYAGMIETETEERPVVCEWDYHSPERHMKRLIRQDTFAVVETVPMNEHDEAVYAAEMQTTLPI